MSHLFVFFLPFVSHYAKLKKLEEEREKELAAKYRDRVNNFQKLMFKIH